MTFLHKLIFSILVSCFFLLPTPIFAQDARPTTQQMLKSEDQNMVKYNWGSDESTGLLDTFIGYPGATLGGVSETTTDGRTVPIKTGFLQQNGRFMALLFEHQPSSREFALDLFENMGLPHVSKALAQGTGYQALSPFLPVWKAFRNLAYTVYILIFMVIGVMIMLRTKVNAQTIVSIQAALPNLVITLVLITFSYAIVGFLVDIMYFSIYFIVYVLSASGLIQNPDIAITRLLSYPAWGVIFEGRNTLVTTVAKSIEDIFIGLTEFPVFTKILLELPAIGNPVGVHPAAYSLVAIAMAVQMIKLMYVLLVSYIKLIVQLVTSPVQIMFNAIPGNNGFGNWFKTTVSHLVPYPVVAAMFMFAAILIGPERGTMLGWVTGSNNDPLGIGNKALINQNDTLWAPPFTYLTNQDNAIFSIKNDAFIAVLGFMIVLMTPAAVKMAQEWFQVKDSPYTSEAFSGIGAAWGLAQYPINMVKGVQHQQEARSLAQQQARWNAEALKNVTGGGK